MTYTRRTPSVLALACLFILGVFLLLPGASQSETDKIPNRRIKAGIFNFGGYHSKDSNGNLSGYGIDLLGMLSEYSHLNFDLIGYDNSWHDMLEMLQNGEIDLVSSARRTPEREEVFAFSLPVGRNNTVLMRQAYNPRLRSGEYATYNGIKIGAVAGSSQNKSLDDFARDKGFTYTLVEFESPEEMASALQNGEVDAILSSNLRKPHNETLLDVIQSDNFYVIARKEDQALIDEINYAIEQMNLNEGDWQNDIYYRYYGPRVSTTPEYSDREKKYIDAVVSGQKTITATSRDDIPPYSYIENGKLKGILPDYFARVMRIAGLPYKLVPIESIDEYKRRANDNEITVVLDRLRPQLLEENEPRQGFTTNPYMMTGLARVTRTDFNGPIKTVALPDTSPIDIHHALLKNVVVKNYPTPEDAMRAVQRGEADAAYTLPYTAQLFVNRDPRHGLYYTMMNSRGANFRMYVPANTDHELISILNKSIKGIPTGTLNQLSSNYISFNAGDVSIYHYLQANPGILLLSALALTLLTSTILVMWFRGKWNKRLLAATENANHELEEQLAIVEALSRDYSNVLAINQERGTISVIKVGGFVQRGLPEAPKDEKDYIPVLANYIKNRVHPEDREYVSKALALDTVFWELATKDEYTGTYRIIDNGETHHYQFTFVRLHETDSGEENLILGGFRNIDEMIRREQEQKNALKEALAQARYASAAKTAFLNNMSHDIRTPMNAIIGFTTLAASNIRNAPMVQRYLGKIMTSGNHLLSLINDVLDMSRIESGKVKIEEKENSLPEILHDLRTIGQSDIKSKQLSFQIDTLNVFNETIFCDRLRLNQVLLNILGNAMKYTHPGGKVSVRVAQLGPAHDGKASYEFRVKDSGIGMSEEFLKHVFEPFEREQTSTVSGIQGTGLGLAITKNIVDMMEGTIEVQSELNKGSEFIVTFTFRVTEQEEPQGGLPQYAGKPALVVDDDVNTCTSLSKMISNLGMRPDWTTLGKEALVRTEFACEQHEPYAAYFIDWMMADMNGIELTRRLRKIVPASVPIIILTAYDWTDIEEEGMEAGVTAFCSKPVFLSELRHVLAQPSRQTEKQKETPQKEEMFTGKRILLVEDNEMNQEIAQMILENAGFELDIAEDGQQAVDKMNEMPAGTYALILMDVQMPVMNGYDATRAIRKMEDSLKASIPIIAMTANAFDEDREEAINSGMNGYVAKPIDIKKLMQTLTDTLSGASDTPHI